ncbi:discoidin domain-containing protein [Thiolapillus sp.]
MACLLGLAPVAASDVQTGEENKNILLMKNGAVILAHTGQYDKEFPVNAMIEGTLQNYWASSNPGPRGWAPQSFVIELDQQYSLARLVVDNRETDEKAFPGVSARQVRFSASTESSKSGWKPVATVDALQFSRKEVKLTRPVTARWLKVEVLSNFGNASYTEINELEAYGKPLGRKVPFMDPNGVYQTNYRLLQLQVEGDRVTGCYEMDRGYVHGTTNGRVFDIEWIEHKGEERGTALLVLSSGGFLNGLWYEDGVMKGPWYGNKLRGQAEIDCDPVTAAMGVGFNADTLVDQSSKHVKPFVEQ